MQVAIRWRYVDPPGLDGFAVPRMTRRKCAGSTENSGEGATHGTGEVDYYKDCGWKIRREAPHNLSDRFDAPGGSSDDNDVPPNHVLSDAEVPS
jgi:hypothetical protein